MTRIPWATAGIAGALAIAYLPASADAAVTSASCTSRTTQAHVWSGSGEDYSDLYETALGQAPASNVSASSQWTCSPYNPQPGVTELIFTTTLGPTGSVGGSTLLSSGCGNLYVRRNGLTVTVVTGPAPSQVQPNGRFTCDWHVPVVSLASGSTYVLNVVGQTMRYEWESGPLGASYLFNVWLQVHSEVTDHTASRDFDVPVCFRTAPGLSCSLLGSLGDPLGT